MPPLRRVLNALLYFPSRTLSQTPADAGLGFRDVTMRADDGVRLHGWWIPSPRPARGHVLVCHGNAGNVGDRVLHAALLCHAGFDVLLFDYRGYGASSGRPDEDGTHRDARAAREALLAQPGTEPGRVVYLGESLGGAVALRLALEQPPAGLVLQAAFTSVRDVARVHHPYIPARLVPDAYPSLRCIAALRVPLLVLHGERDTIVPVAHGRALFDAAPPPKALRTFPDAGHNDLVSTAGTAYADAITAWAQQLWP